MQSKGSQFKQHHNFMESQLHLKKSIQRQLGQSRDPSPCEDLPSPKYLVQNLFF